MLTRLQTGKECSFIKWELRKDLYRSTPDDTLVAIVIDLDQTTPGSVRIWDGKDFIGMVGNTKDLVIIPWHHGWWYVCYQAQRIGEVR